MQPRIRRRRRGHDFLANYRSALRTALNERVDIVVHGGDVFHRPSVPASLVHQAFEPLKDVADAGISVFVVPGNHERSRIPFDWLSRHPNVHVFKVSSTVWVSVGRTRVGISGIPCIRRDARTRFTDEVERSGWLAEPADLRLLVTHQAFEGAVVGPSDFTFRRGHDVVRMADVPTGFAAVLSGHIHRSQVLTTDLRGATCPVPVFYPGSVERTAFAERHEPKGFLLLEIRGGPAGGEVADWSFRDLPARPMLVRTLELRGMSVAAVVASLKRALNDAPPDAVLRLEADAPPSLEAQRVLSTEIIRRLAPSTMNVDVLVPGQRARKGGRMLRRGGVGIGGRRNPHQGANASPQGSLFDD